MLFRRSYFLFDMLPSKDYCSSCKEVPRDKEPDEKPPSY